MIPDDVDRVHFLFPSPGGTSLLLKALKKPALLWTTNGSSRIGRQSKDKDWSCGSSGLNCHLSSIHYAIYKPKNLE